MQMVLQIFLLLVGFVALIKGADIFVDGSSSLAAIFKVPTVIIGLTIVALGTSAPELAVSTSAALKGANEIALSNVVGSNLFNLLMVLGVCAMIKPVPIEDVIKKRDYPFSIIVTVLLYAALAISAIGQFDFATVKMSDKEFKVRFEQDLGDGAVGINFGSMYLDHWSWVCLDVIKHFYETGEFVETGSDYLDGQNENVIGSIVEAQGKTWNDVKIIHEVNRTA